MAFRLFCRTADMSSREPDVEMNNKVANSSANNVVDAAGATTVELQGYDPTENTHGKPLFTLSLSFSITKTELESRRPVGEDEGQKVGQQRGGVGEREEAARRPAARRVREPAPPGRRHHQVPAQITRARHSRIIPAPH